MKPNLVELDADHPGFHDKDYRRRRDEIAKLAENHELGKPLPVVEFTETETATWRTVYAELSKLFPTHGCHEYNEALKLLGFSGEAIPQLADLDKSLTSARGFASGPCRGSFSPGTSSRHSRSGSSPRRST